MNEENAKLAQVKKSCKAAKIVSKIVFIAAIVGCILALAASITVFSNLEKFDKSFAQSEGSYDITLGSGNVHLAKIPKSDMMLLRLSGENMESDVPAIQEYLDEHNGSMALIIAVYMIAIAAICLVMAVIAFLIMSVFAIIIKEGNPFAEKVLKRILVSMIILSALVLLTVGFGYGLIMGLFTWVVYTILDYGRTLQTLSDETL